MSELRAKALPPGEKKKNEKNNPKPKQNKTPTLCLAVAQSKGTEILFLCSCCLESCKTFALLQLATNPGAGCILHCVRRKKKEKREKERFGPLNGPEGQAQLLERRNWLLSVYLQRL